MSPLARRRPANMKYIIVDCGPGIMASRYISSSRRAEKLVTRTATSSKVTAFVVAIDRRGVNGNGEARQRAHVVTNDDMSSVGANVCGVK